MLSWTLYSSFIGAAICTLWPNLSAQGARRVALSSAIVGFAAAMACCIQYDPQATELVQFASKQAWIPSLGISFQIGADGISLTLVLLTGLAAITGILFSWDINTRTREFFAFFPERLLQNFPFPQATTSLCGLFTIKERRGFGAYEPIVGRVIRSN